MYRILLKDFFKEQISYILLQENINIIQIKKKTKILSWKRKSISGHVVKDIS